MKKKKLQKIETIATHAGIKPEENHGIVNPPVYHASTILSHSMKNYKDRSKKKYTYGRNGKPTSTALHLSESFLAGEITVIIINPIIFKIFLNKS